MQGLHNFIPTATKINYINLLLEVGFDCIDFGSFVSPKAIPQLADTAGVLSGLKLENSSSELLSIVANKRGIDEAVTHSKIKHLGFPFSISETFQQRNTNSSIENSMETVHYLIQECQSHDKNAVIYLSMCFGNPYGDEWSPVLVKDWVIAMNKLGVKTISLADTVGLASPELIGSVFNEVLQVQGDAVIGAHLHSTHDEAESKIEAAYEAGCRRFDTAMKGFGGCPMAKDDLVGNIATEVLLAFLDKRGIHQNFDRLKFLQSMEEAVRIMS